MEVFNGFERGYVDLQRQTIIRWVDFLHCTGGGLHLSYAFQLKPLQHRKPVKGISGTSPDDIEATRNNLKAH